MTSFWLLFRWEYIVVSTLIYYRLRQVLYCLPQLWSVHTWILWTVYHLGVNRIYFISLSRLFKVSIYHDNVWYLGCNINVCGYCRDTVFVVVTRQVGYYLSWLKICMGPIRHYIVDAAVRNIVHNLLLLLLLGKHPFYWKCTFLISCWFGYKLTSCPDCYCPWLRHKQTFILRWLWVSLGH